MRNQLLFLLLASAAMPAVAADEATDRAARRDAARAERAEARSERQAGRAERSPDSQPQSEARVVERSEPPAAREERREERREAVQQRIIERQSGGDEVDAIRPALEQRRDAADGVREWRREEREQVRAARAPGPKMIEAPAGSFRESLRERRQERIEGRDSIGNRRAPIVSRVPREGTQPPLPAVAKPSSLTTRHWRGDWRSDHRYNWRDHRRRHRSLFHFGFYYDPFGWGYRPFSIGWRMWPSYYRSSYWLNDPWQYRLPPAYPPYRWIRYYDDALLVDTWSGEVVDVIHDFFW